MYLIIWRKLLVNCLGEGKFFEGLIFAVIRKATLFRRPLIRNYWWVGNDFIKSFQINNFWFADSFFWQFWQCVSKHATLDCKFAFPETLGTVFVFSVYWINVCNLWWCFRLNRTPIKLQVYAVEPNLQQKELIGLVMIDLKKADQKPLVGSRSMLHF